MSESNLGLMVAMMEPSPTLEEEFQEWYDTEHFPEREQTEGFLTATRLVCLDGWPRYAALYDLADVAVLHGPAYARIAGDRYSRWTNRVVPRVWGRYRAEAVQAFPGGARYGQNGRAARIVFWRFRQAGTEFAGQIVAGLQSLYTDAPETAQLRVFEANREDESADYLGIVELHAPLDLPRGAVAALGDARRYLDLLNVYTEYRRTWTANAGAAAVKPR